MPQRTSVEDFLTPGYAHREKRWSSACGGNVHHPKLEPGQPELHSAAGQALHSRITIAAAPGGPQEMQEEERTKVDCTRQSTIWHGVARLR
ncbi:hypothetical protein Y1Q_0007042 [Alligator mississippiensis]|uniref:Uncharacterized protein n=1 Tax=Alligator mississippiensis TaxID=8496 RepID=A0A151N5D8_ALLMI|nr:hypothetical protein Y1Q_0007042 [Alligator mississippiensis]